MDVITQEGNNKSIPVDMLCSAMQISRATYYRHVGSNQCAQNKIAPRTTAVNALNSQEKQCVLDLLHSERFIDKTPYVVVK